MYERYCESSYQISTVIVWVFFWGFDSAGRLLCYVYEFPALSVVMTIIEKMV